MNISRDNKITLSVSIGEIITALRARHGAEFLLMQLPANGVGVTTVIAGSTLVMTYVRRVDDETLQQRRLAAPE